MKAHPNVELILATVFDQVLVAANTSGFECFWTQLFIFIGNQMNAKWEIMYGCLLSAQIENTDFSVWHTTTETWFWIRFVFAVAIAEKNRKKSCKNVFLLPPFKVAMHGMRVWLSLALLRLQFSRQLSPHPKSLSLFFLHLPFLIKGKPNRIAWDFSMVWCRWRVKNIFFSLFAWKKSTYHLAGRRPILELKFHEKNHKLEIFNTLRLWRFTSFSN